MIGAVSLLSHGQARRACGFLDASRPSRERAIARSTVGLRGWFSPIDLRKRASRAVGAFCVTSLLDESEWNIVLHHGDVAVFGAGPPVAPRQRAPQHLFGLFRLPTWLSVIPSAPLASNSPPVARNCSTAVLSTDRRLDLASRTEKVAQKVKPTGAALGVQAFSGLPVDRHGSAHQGFGGAKFLARRERSKGPPGPLRRRGPVPSRFRRFLRPL